MEHHRKCSDPRGKGRFHRTALSSRRLYVIGVMVAVSVWGGRVRRLHAADIANKLVPWVTAAEAPFVDGQAPRTPAGLAPCTQGLEPVGDLPRGKGETLRYLVDVDGLSVGSVDFKIERRGMFKGLPVVEYRCLFKIDALVATFMALDGRAATLVTSPGSWPIQAMNRYRLDDKQITEDMSYSGMGHTMIACEVKNGEEKRTKRTFPTPVQDFLSAFYLVRRLPNKPSCAVIYGNERAYTVWIEPDGIEEIKTPAGLRTTDRYALRYSSDRGVRVISGHVWLAQDTARVPMRAQLDGPHKIEAQLHLFQSGE